MWLHLPQCGAPSVFTFSKHTTLPHDAHMELFQDDKALVKNNKRYQFNGCCQNTDMLLSHKQCLCLLMSKKSLLFMVIALFQWGHLMYEMGPAINSEIPAFHPQKIDSNYRVLISVLRKWLIRKELLVSCQVVVTSSRYTKLMAMHVCPSLMRTLTPFHLSCSHTHGPLVRDYSLMKGKSTSTCKTIKSTAYISQNSIKISVNIKCWGFMHSIRSIFTFVRLPQLEAD